MPSAGRARTVLLILRSPLKEVTVNMNRLLLGCLLALLLVPAAASATYPAGDGPGGISRENGARPAATAATAPPTIVRNITTHDGSQTVPLVLAALALSVAIAGSGYVALRVRPSLRS